MAAKRRRTVAPSSAPAASGLAAAADVTAEASVSDGPITRSRAGAVRAAMSGREDPNAVVDTLDFMLSSDSFQADHVAAWYRTAANDAGQHAVPVREKADHAASDALAEALGFPSPFIAVNLSDRKGVWQTEPPVLKQLGEDPSKQERPTHFMTMGGSERRAAAPAGLRNLGATCYMNSLLQYLFFNTDFRCCLLRADSSSEPVQALQRIFALMLESRRNIVDPSEFVRVAGVETGEQEDVQEFSLLLLDWLERALDEGNKSSDRGGGFIPTLFQGTVSRILTCLENPDHTFERREPFLELRASLTLTSGTASTPAATQATGTRRGSSTPAGRATPPPSATVIEPPQTSPAATPSAPAGSGASSNGAKRGSGGKRKTTSPLVRLEELLSETAFPDEMLTGSNKYHCPTCEKKVDARNSTRLAEPPPYLHITIERYHYDLQKGERKKLNNPVSFPQHLRLRSCGSEPTEKTRNPGCRTSTAQADVVVTYDCVGFLEHVSDSAHSGHYTATLYQEEVDSMEALKLAGSTKLPAEGDADAGAAGPQQSLEPPTKRLCCDSADAAAGSPEPRRGLWWTLDDDRISPVEWQGSKAQASSEGVQPESSKDTCTPPERIESASAYLILYRRRGYVHKCSGDQIALSRQSPPHLSSVVAADNRAFAQEQETYKARSVAVQSFLTERRLAVKHLVQALRAVIPKLGAVEDSASATQAKTPALSVVPTSWLTQLLHGDDRSIRELLDGRNRPAPVMYGRSLIRSLADEQGLILDPLAVWCGEVKLLPTAAFEELGGIGGLDSSLFLEFKDGFGDSVCKAARSLYKCFEAEWLQIRKILTEGKITVADARQWQSEDRADDVVWLSLRVQKLWQKAIDAGGATKGQPSQLVVVRAFLREVHAARWLGHSMAAEEPDQEDAPADASLGSAPAQSSTNASVQAGTGEVDLTVGIVCEHGLVCNTRAGFLARRNDVVELLQLANAKEQAYQELWRHTPVVPRMRSGVSDGELLSFGETCSVCGVDGRAGVTTGMGNADSAGVHKLLTVKRRYPSSGVTRRHGNLAVGESVTGSELRELLLEQFKYPVLRVFAELNGKEVELQSGDKLEEAVSCIVVEKDESVANREASAFQGSIFRSS